MGDLNLGDLSIGEILLIMVFAFLAVFTTVYFVLQMLYERKN